MFERMLTDHAYAHHTQLKNKFLLVIHKYVNQTESMKKFSLPSTARF